MVRVDKLRRRDKNQPTPSLSIDPVSFFLFLCTARCFLDGVRGANKGHIVIIDSFSPSPGLKGKKKRTTAAAELFLFNNYYSLLLSIEWDAA